jgi:uncharacterized membrane protein YidH (DUF202 family)
MSQTPPKDDHTSIQNISPVDLMAVERATTALFSTAISFIVLGFVIEKFQLFLALASVELTDKQFQRFPELANGAFYHYLGVAIIGAGVLLALYSYRFYSRWVKLLSRHKIETDKKLYFSVAFFIATVGILIISSMIFI